MNDLILFFAKELYQDSIILKMIFICLFATIKEVFFADNYVFSQLKNYDDYCDD